MKFSELKAQEEAKRLEARQLSDTRQRRWEHSSGLVVIMYASDDGISVTLDCPELRTGNLSSEPLQWLTSDRLRFIARCREKLEAWVDGGDAPDERE